MIIRRMADAIRTQNWFTVIIEVLIVVIGIFIGLQVDDWNQTRKANVQNQIIMAQLDEDINEVLVNIDAAVIIHKQYIDWGKLALRYLNSEDILADHQIEIENAFQRMHQLPKPQLLSGHLDSVLSGGIGQLITDQAMQRELVTLTSALVRGLDIYRHIEDRITEISAIHRQMVGFAAPGDEGLAITYDGEALRRSAAFKIAMQNAVVFHRYGFRALEVYADNLKQYQTRSAEPEVTP